MLLLMISLSSLSLSLPLSFLSPPSLSFVVLKGLNDSEQSVNCYRQVLQCDSTCVEAIACIATDYFYSDQPEIALSYYR